MSRSAEKINFANPYSPLGEFGVSSLTFVAMSSMTYPDVQQYICYALHEMSRSVLNTHFCQPPPPWEGVNALKQFIAGKCICCPDMHR